MDHSLTLLQANVVALAMLWLAACIIVWAIIAARRARRQPVLPYESRRQVPWGAIDIIVIVAMLIFTQAAVMSLGCKWMGIKPKDLSLAAEAVADKPDDPMSRAHPLAILLLKSHSPWVILLCVVSAVVVAPISEEFLFRLVLQGWLESLERRMRRRIPWLRRSVAGFLPVTTAAILFGAMHGRSAEPPTNLHILVFSLCVYCISSSWAVVASVFWLKFVAGATLADFGIVPCKLGRDLRTGGIAFLAVAMPVLISASILNYVMPKNVVVDPIPIFFLAIALGTLYYRTHRIIPSLALHMAFNAVGVFVALAM